MNDLQTRATWRKDRRIAPNTPGWSLIPADHWNADRLRKAINSRAPFTSFIKAPSTVIRACANINGSIPLDYRSDKSALAPLITGGVVMVMGGLTIALHDPSFIKIKPTIVNLTFAGILLGGVVVGKRGLLKYVLDVAFSLTDEGWRILSKRWGFFFLFLAALNECIWRNFSEDFWVNFKVFGMFTLTIAFAVSQFRVVEKYRA